MIVYLMINKGKIKVDNCNFDELLIYNIDCIEIIEKNSIRYYNIKSFTDEDIRSAIMNILYNKRLTLEEIKVNLVEMSRTLFNVIFNNLIFLNMIKKEDNEYYLV